MYELDWTAPGWLPPTAQQIWDRHRAKVLLIVMAVVALVALNGDLIAMLTYAKWALLIGGAYFLPSIVATARGVRNRGSVVVVNLFLGWTFLGWVIALALACRSVDETR